MQNLETRSTPLLVLTDSRRAALCARLEQVLQTWLRTWGSGASLEFASASLVIGKSPGTLPSDFDRAVVAENAGVAHAAIATRDSLLGVAVGLPANVRVSTVSGRIAQEIHVELLKGLLGQLVAGSNEAWAMRYGDRRWLQERLASEKLRWQIDVIGGQREQMRMWLAPALIAVLAPSAAQHTSTPVIKRRAALGEESIRLEAVLGEANVAIGDLASLQVNDVIVMQDEISRPGYLLTDAGKRVASVVFGRVGARRAAQIAPAAPSRPS